MVQLRLDAPAKENARTGKQEWVGGKNPHRSTERCNGIGSFWGETKKGLLLEKQIKIISNKNKNELK